MLHEGKMLSKSMNKNILLQQMSINNPKGFRVILGFKPNEILSLLIMETNLKQTCQYHCEDHNNGACLLKPATAP